MDKINRALHELDSLSQKANENNRLNNINPLVKFALVLLYIGLIVSVNKFDFYRTLSFGILPVIIFSSGILSFKEAVYRLRVVLPLVAAVGIFNPIFDRSVFQEISLFGKNFIITSGTVSFFTLLLKGIFTVLASYILIASTSIEKLCSALKTIHVPSVIVTQILLIYRYISVLLSEVKKINQAYFLRSPKQKGIHFSAWGSLVGNLLLHSMDRAQNVYDSMCLRGFDSANSLVNAEHFSFSDFFILIIGTAVLVCLKIFPVLQIIGGLFS